MLEPRTRKWRSDEPQAARPNHDTVGSITADATYAGPDTVVHGAMHAVYSLFGVDKPIPPIYSGMRDPKVALLALESAFR